MNNLNTGERISLPDIFQSCKLAYSFIYVNIISLPSIVAFCFEILNKRDLKI